MSLSPRAQASADLRIITSRRLPLCMRVQHAYWLLEDRGLASPALKRLMDVTTAEDRQGLRRSQAGLS